jgi:exopolyphosphatase/guanosine-5'-triphosphate,3'-diphosphate pyrophosphatase
LNQYELDRLKLAELSQTLCALRLDKRLDLPGIDERRADILPTGSVVLATALALLGADRAVHSEWGLREGVVLGEIGAPAPRSSAELRETSVGRLAATWGANDHHAASVRGHALRLFDETHALHDLGVIERELLGHAARVHNVGARISPDKHHKHGAYVVEHAGLRGFSPDEVALMACIVRFHRGTGPKTGYAPFGALTAAEREGCRVLVGILRIAHGLGRGGSEDVTAIATEIGRRELVIRVEGANPASAVADAEERADVLGKALRCRVLFDIVPVGSIR